MIVPRDEDPGLLQLGTGPAVLTVVLRLQGRPRGRIRPELVREVLFPHRCPGYNESESC